MRALPEGSCSVVWGVPRLSKESWLRAECDRRGRLHIFTPTEDSLTDASTKSCIRTAITAAEANTTAAAEGTTAAEGTATATSKHSRRALRLCRGRTEQAAPPWLLNPPKAGLPPKTGVAPNP